MFQRPGLGSWSRFFYYLCYNRNKLIMKKLLLITTLLIFSCSKEKDCTCTGEFTKTFKDDYPVFEVDSVNCKTGEPFIKADKPNLATFLGCKEK